MGCLQGTVDTLKWWDLKLGIGYLLNVMTNEYMFDRLKLARTAPEQICHLDMEEKMLQRVHEQNLYNWDHLQNGFKNRQKDLVYWNTKGNYI